MTRILFLNNRMLRILKKAEMKGRAIRKTKISDKNLSDSIIFWEKGILEFLKMKSLLISKNKFEEAGVKII